MTIGLVLIPWEFWTARPEKNQTGFYKLMNMYHFCRNSKL